MSWTQNETEQYLLDISNNVGMFSDNLNNCHIAAFSREITYTTFLEIGTWNGLGSTKTFADSFDDRLYDNYTLYSLECNKEKCEYAANLYINNPNIHILNEVLWNDLPSNFYELYPECLNNEEIKAQFDVDLENMKKCNLFLERPELPEIFDFVLLDGGDCTTYFDFQAIKNKCRYLYVNDIINYKGKYILNEIIKDTKTWNIMAFNKKNNTFVLAENILIKYAQYLEKTPTIEIPRVKYETPPDFPIHMQRYNEEQ